MKLKLITTFLIIFNIFVCSSIIAGDDDELNDPSFYGFHKVTHIKLEFDPYEGKWIDAYWIYLDNNTIWWFDWSLYEWNNISLKKGDQVKISYNFKDDLPLLMSIYSPKEIIRVRGYPNNEKWTKIQAYDVQKNISTKP